MYYPSVHYIYSAATSHCIFGTWGYEYLWGGPPLTDHDQYIYMYVLSYEI